jgi:hypothetical protein
MFLFTVFGAEDIKCPCCKLNGHIIYDSSKYCHNGCDCVPVLFMQNGQGACDAVADGDIRHRNIFCVANSVL